MGTTITREQRDAMYQDVVDDLHPIGDLYTLLSHGEWEDAQRHRRRFEDDLRLLDDLGWEAEQARDEFVLTMPRDDLARVLRHLSDGAADLLHRLVVMPVDERELVQRALTVQAACSDLLAQLSQTTTAAAEIEPAEST